MNKQETGRFGEDLAADYLEKEGYIIQERNWRSGHLEVDIIARKDNIWVFVEVKTRRSDLFGNPELAVDKDKMKKILRAAEAYCEGREEDIDLRFDIISVIPGDVVQMKHLENAFDALGLS